MKHNIKTVHHLTGEILFEKDNIDAPDEWSHQAVVTAATKYMQPNEFSIEEFIERTTKPFKSHLPQEIIERIKQYILNQQGAFNSPYFFNFGVHDNPMGSACFILRTEDTIEDIARTVSECYQIFKNGSGAGFQCGHWRGSMEPLSHSDGVASGPLSFIKNIDSVGGTVKSGGRTRRAAIMVNMYSEHPDIYDFVNMKWKEEQKAHILAKAGYGSDMDSESYSTVAFQNLNSSVFASDSFMRAVEEGGSIDLVAVNTGDVIRTVDANDLINEICDKAWRCGDPGIQYADTINNDHTCPSAGKITSSNPCSEFMFIDDSACNLASINLNKVITDSIGSNGEISDSNTLSLSKITSDFIRAMDRIITVSGYPTESIKANSVKYRPLGLGFTGLASLLMANGIPYDSERGRSAASNIMSIMLRAAVFESSRMADEFGHNMSEQEQSEIRRWVSKRFPDVDWSGHNFRNAQWTLLAPTGTISFLMDTGDSTGIEPVVSLTATKRLAGGGTVKIASPGVKKGLNALGYDAEQGQEYLNKHGTLTGFVRPEHESVFIGAINIKHPQEVVSPIGHLKMMKACQPWLSGAISKTVNLPKTATPEDIKDIYMWGWKNGLKAIAVYREGTKMGAPIDDGGSDSFATTPVRRRLPDTRQAITHHFEIMGQDGYLTLGFYGKPEDKELGEILVTLGAEGSAIHGLLSAWSRSFSYLLQYGVPPLELTPKYRGIKADPRGMTNHPDIQVCNSVFDFTAQFIELFLTGKISGGTSTIDQFEIPSPEKGQKIAPLCQDCGNEMVMGYGGRGCWHCLDCGASGGCS